MLSPSIISTNNVVKRDLLMIRANLYTNSWFKTSYFDIDVKVLNYVFSLIFWFICNFFMGLMPRVCVCVCVHAYTQYICFAIPNNMSKNYNEEQHQPYFLDIYGMPSTFPR